MEITRTLAISAEELFDQIEKTIIADIREATGKEVPRAKLNGYKYKKVARGGGRSGTPMDVKIKHYRYPELYEARFSYATGVNTVRYEVTEASDDSVTVLYREDLEPRGNAPRGLTGMLNRKIYERRLRSRAQQIFKSLEETVKRERSARENNPALSELEDSTTEEQSEE